jgi:hypothetical protein
VRTAASTRFVAVWRGIGADARTPGGLGAWVEHGAGRGGQAGGADQALAGQGRHHLNADPERLDQAGGESPVKRKPSFEMLEIRRGKRRLRLDQAPRRHWMCDRGDRCSERSWGSLLSRLRQRQPSGRAVAGAGSGADGSRPPPGSPAQQHSHRHQPRLHPSQLALSDGASRHAGQSAGASAQLASHLFRSTWVGRGIATPAVLRAGACRGAGANRWVFCRVTRPPLRSRSVDKPRLGLRREYEVERDGVVPAVDFTVDPARWLPRDDFRATG